LGRYHWPGNVRELRNVVERAIALCPHTQITPLDLPEAIRNVSPAPEHEAPAPATFDQHPRPRTLNQSKHETEIRRIMEALHKHQNKRSRAAKELGISRVGLYKKLQKYGLL